MTIAGAMKNACLGILAAYGRDKDELTNSEARNVQDYIRDETGIMADDRDIKIFFSTFAREYWKSHTRPPAKRREYMGVVHAC